VSDRGGCDAGVGDLRVGRCVCECVCMCVCVCAAGQMRELEKRRKVDPKKKLAAGTPDVKAEKTFVLRSLLPAEMRRMHVDSPAQRARHAFTMTVLALLVSNSASDQIFEGACFPPLDRNLQRMHGQSPCCMHLMVPGCLRDVKEVSAAALCVSCARS
jgi:hypothetical protein